MLIGQERPMVELGERKGKHIWEAGVPKNMEEYSLYKLSRLVLLESSHNGVGKCGRETEWPFVLAIDCWSIHLCCHPPLLFVSTSLSVRGQGGFALRHEL